jgi:hypothetical protein
MTGNQRRAIALAEQICEGTVSATHLSDADWGLLLLAADVTNTHSLPLLVCYRVLDRASRGLGYFAGVSTADLHDCRRVPANPASDHDAGASCRETAGLSDAEMAGEGRAGQGRRGKGRTGEDGGAGPRAAAGSDRTTALDDLGEHLPPGPWPSLN